MRVRGGGESREHDAVPSSLESDGSSPMIQNGNQELAMASRTKGIDPGLTISIGKWTITLESSENNIGVE